MKWRQKLMLKYYFFFSNNLHARMETAYHVTPKNIIYRYRGHRVPPHNKHQPPEPPGLYDLLNSRLFSF